MPTGRRESMLTGEYVYHSHIKKDNKIKKRREVRRKKKQEKQENG